MATMLFLAMVLGALDNADRQSPRSLPNCIKCQVRVIHRKAGASKEDAGQLVLKNTLSTVVGRPIHARGPLRLAAHHACVVAILPVRADDGTYRVSVNVSLEAPAGAEAVVGEVRELRLRSGNAGSCTIRDDRLGGELTVEVRLHSDALVDRFPDLVPTLVSALGSPDERARANAFETLDALGSDAIPDLLGALATADPTVRPLTARVIGRIVLRESWHRDDVVGPLAKAARSNDTALRNEAILALKHAIVGSPSM